MNRARARMVVSGLVATLLVAAAAITQGSPAVVSGDEDVCPLVLIHGISGSPGDWRHVLDALEHGRTAVREAYADDVAALAPGSVPRSSIWALGYYKRRGADAPYYGGRGSMGGCPAPRTDGLARYFSVAYVDAVDDTIEAILRATGARRVDLVGCSMGGVVSRAYVRWRSGRGPGGESRVRRFLILESPNRGLDDVEAAMLALDQQTFQRWGEVAELARDYPGWSGASYIHHLNDGWDAWCDAHGVAYGGLYGSGHSVLAPGTLERALDTVRRLARGGGSPRGAPPANPAPANPAPASSPPPGVPAPPGGVPIGPAPVPPRSTSPLGLGRGTTLQAIAQSLIFIDPARLDLPRCLAEVFSDGDGFVRASNGSLDAGPEFPHRLFDMKFRGLHLDRGQPDETIQYALDTRELVRRFCLEGRTPRGTQLVHADVGAVSAAGRAPWLELDYELQGSDGVSLQLFTEDLGRWALRQVVPFFPDDPVVHGLPAFEGAHRVRIDGDPAGPRVATLVVYDVDGIVAEVGPFFLNGTPGTPGLDRAPGTSVVSIASGGPVATVALASNGAAPELSWRLVPIAGPLAAPAPWSPWTTSATLQVSGAQASPGTYELFVRSRHADNAAGILVEQADPLELGVRLDGAGNVFIRP